MRFARWDSPLFTVLWDDEMPPCEAIWEALVGSDEEGGKKVVRPNQATVLKAPSSEGYLYELDKSRKGFSTRYWSGRRITQGREVVRLVLERVVVKNWSSSCPRILLVCQPCRGYEDSS